MRTSKALALEEKVFVLIAGIIVICLSQFYRYVLNKSGVSKYDKCCSMYSIWAAFVLWQKSLERIQFPMESIQWVTLDFKSTSHFML